MEDLITITEAAQRAGVTDKTLRRAIDAGKLVAQPRVYKNQPIMIAEQDLDQWIASRSVQIVVQASGVDPGLASRMADLEATVQRLQEQSEIDHKLAYSRIDALEKLLRELQETLLREQQETVILRRRIVELETSQDPFSVEQLDNRYLHQDFVLDFEQRVRPIEKAVGSLVGTQANDQELEAPRERTRELVAREMTRMEQTSVPAPETGTFELADFSQLLQREYRSSATRGDVKASLTLRPEPLGIEGDYRVDYFACGRADGQRRPMRKEQQARGEQLKSDLRSKVRSAAFTAGWQDGPHDIWVCPKGKQ